MYEVFVIVMHYYSTALDGSILKVIKIDIYWSCMWVICKGFFLLLLPILVQDIANKKCYAVLICQNTQINI